MAQLPQWTQQLLFRWAGLSVLVSFTLQTHHQLVKDAY